jgi:hypothetical protein
MTEYAQGASKTISFVKQSAKGTPGSTGSQLLRLRPGSVFSVARDTFESDEITPDRMSRGITYGQYKPAGKLPSYVEPGTHKLLYAALLCADFAAVTPYSAGTDVTAQVAAPQFSDASGGFLTAGLKVFDVIRWTGWATTGTPNNSRNFLITALTATDMTGVFLDDTAPGPKAAGDAVTATVVGKKTKAPLTALTKDYFSVEEKYADISPASYELYVDQRCSQAAVSLPASGNAAVDFDFIGLSRTVSASETLTSPTAATTTPILNSTNGVIYVNGVAVVGVTGASFTLSGTMSAGEAAIGSNYSTDVNIGQTKLSGQFTAKFDTVTLQALFDNETPVSLGLIVNDSPTATSDFVTFVIGRIKITSDTPDHGEKEVIRTYSWTAERNTAGGAALAWDDTILTIQDSAA